jgi:hypothetical protein
VAAISFFSGLILDVLRQKNRQDFEMRLLDVRNPTVPQDLSF